MEYHEYLDTRQRLSWWIVSHLWSTTRVLTSETSAPPSGRWYTHTHSDAHTHNRARAHTTHTHAPAHTHAPSDSHTPTGAHIHSKFFSFFRRKIKFSFFKVFSFWFLVFLVFYFLVCSLQLLFLLKTKNFKQRTSPGVLESLLERNKKKQKCRVWLRAWARVRETVCGWVCVVVGVGAGVWVHGCVGVGVGVFFCFFLSF